MYIGRADQISENPAVRCRNALSLTDPVVDRERIKTTKGQRVTGTCEWIREDNTYRCWLNGDVNLLWICGGPGKGKTMLSIFLTEELEQRVLNRTISAAAKMRNAIPAYSYFEVCCAR